MLINIGAGRGLERTIDPVPDVTVPVHRAGESDLQRIKAGEPYQVSGAYHAG